MLHPVLLALFTVAPGCYNNGPNRLEERGNEPHARPRVVAGHGGGCGLNKVIGGDSAFLQGVIHT